MLFFFSRRRIIWKIPPEREGGCLHCCRYFVLAFVFGGQGVKKKKKKKSNRLLLPSETNNNIFSYRFSVREMSVADGELPGTRRTGQITLKQKLVLVGD